jgi:hypothetical protein
MPMKTREFVETILIDGVEKMQRDGSLYLSCVVMASGIELLGAILLSVPPNSTSISAIGLSRKRFNHAIINLFPSVYHSLLTRTPSLFEGWRCWGVHQLAPGGYGFLGETDALKNGVTHLNERNGVVVLIAEQLCRDFKAASLQVVAAIKNGSLKNDDFLWVPGDTISISSSVPSAVIVGSIDCSGVPPGAR